jgi:hypothetical protein
MSTSQTGSTFSRISAVAWTVVPITWMTAAVLERGRDWEGLPSAVWGIGWLALVVAGAATVMAVVRTRDRTDRRGLRRGGIAALGAGLAVSAIAPWAIPVWSALYGVAMLLVAASGRGGAAARLTGFAFLAAVGSLIVLTALRVGTPDSFGNRPVAWTVATIIATVGAAGGMVVWPSGAPSSVETRSAAVA